ncbi:hypothetical protein AB0383_27195 [Amycolatopsis sp. NPDC051373]|uniref:hypothetical protein n=1 Tax=Amycolatopsis sp. NPDC051373 TaxID=3155801 RepID=UPI00344B9A6E
MRSLETIHRVGQPPETLVSFEWPSDPQFKKDLNIVSGEPQEWAGLLSYTFNRRIEALEEMTIGVEGQLASLALPLSDKVDSSLMAPPDPSSNPGAELTRTLKHLVSLSDSDYDTISSAIQMHYSAILLSVRETNAAYSLLVGAIELLSRRYGEVDSSWEGWSESDRWENRFRKMGLDQAQKARMRKSLLADNKHRNLKRSFVSYVQDRLPISFWKEPVQDWFSTFDSARGTYLGGEWTTPHPRFIDSPTQDLVRRVLSGAYDTRSEFVHAGKRAVNLGEEAMIQIKPQLAKRLPIRALRDALRALIEIELSRRAKDFVLPEVRISPLWLPVKGSFM